MQKNENGFNMATHYGAIVEILPDAATEKVLLSDMRILEATEKKIVPTMLYARHDGAVKISKGPQTRWICPRF